MPKYKAYDFYYEGEGITQIKEGWNEITLTNTGKTPAKVVSVELAIK